MIVARDGRVFGRVNLFDAIVAAFVVALIPIGYAAFLLFRTPEPSITSVEPAQLSFVEERAAAGTPLAGKLKVRGENLRPVLRATIGDQAAIAFIFETPASADVLFGNIAPGTYDLILYDGVQEVVRAPKAVVIPDKSTPTAVARVRIVGNLIDLDEAAARALTLGAKYPPSGAALSEIVALGEPMPDWREIRLLDGLMDSVAQGRWQRSVAILTECDVSAPLQCRIDQASFVGPEAVLNVPGSGGALRMRVQGIVPADPPLQADARVRFLAPADAIDLVKAGDRDESAPLVDGRAATIVSIEQRQIVQGEITLPWPIEGSQLAPSLTASDRVAAIDAVVRLGADRAHDGWRYRAHPLAVGRPLTFVTPRYTIRGIVRSVTVSNAPATPERR